MRHGNFEHNWFIADLCKQLQQFYIDFINGKRPVLLIQSPPQHGKSWAVTDFISWIMGKIPELRTIYASYSDTLGKRCNLAQQRFMDGEKYKKIFPETNLSQTRGGAIRTTEHLEILDVVRNPANADYNRRGVITKGTIVRTEKGLAKIVSRPGQEGSLSAVVYNE